MAVRGPRLPEGSRPARITGTVLSGLGTLGLLIAPAGLHAPGAVAPKILSGVVRLIGAGTAGPRPLR